MRALKVLVVVMGVALVAGTVALVVAVMARVERRGGAAASMSARAEPLHSDLPAGSRIVGTELEGDRLVVHVALADGGEALYLFDARTGSALAVIEAPAKR